MTFLFDIGRVLLDFDLESSLARLPGLQADDRSARMAMVMERKDDFETGAIEPDAFVAWALGVLGSHATPMEFREAWQQIFTPLPAMWQRVRQLASDGHRLLLFSNTNAIHCPWMFDAYPEFSLFHGAVLSYQAGCIKPCAQIYQYAIDHHGLQPQSTYYIDDLPQNIATGREFGFHSWQYDLHNHAAFENWLAGFGL